MSKEIFFGLFALWGFICIVTPKAVAELMLELSWFSAKQSIIRPIIVRFMGATIILLTALMYFGSFNG